MSKFRWYSGSHPGGKLRYIKLIDGDKVVQWRSTKLRKPHKCANCSRIIPAGETAYVRLNWGRPWQRVCTTCVERLEKHAA